MPSAYMSKKFASWLTTILYSSSRQTHHPRKANVPAAIVIRVPRGFFIAHRASSGKIKYACISIAMVQEATPMGVAI